MRLNSSLWPALKRRHSKQRQHPIGDVVEVEVLVFPFALRVHRFIDVTIHVHDELASERKRNIDDQMSNAFSAKNRHDHNHNHHNKKPSCR